MRNNQEKIVTRVCTSRDVYQIIDNEYLFMKILPQVKLDPVITLKESNVRDGVKKSSHVVPVLLRLVVFIIVEI